MMGISSDDELPAAAPSYSMKICKLVYNEKKGEILPTFCRSTTRRSTGLFTRNLG